MTEPTFIEQFNTDSNSAWRGKRFLIEWNNDNNDNNDNRKSSIDLGLCCINTELRASKPSVFSNRTCRLATAYTKGEEYVKTLALKNIKDVLKILEWNKNHNIRAYRLSSDMFPHINNPKLGDEDFEYGSRYSLDFAKPILKEIGKLAKAYGIRLSFHPGQYNQIASPTQSVFDNTVRDLSVHSYILDLIEDELDMGENRAIICIHGGGVYKEKQKTMNRWCDRFMEIPEEVRSRICIENCEKCYSSEDCLEISRRLNIPHIFDIHHYNCYDLLHKEEIKNNPQKSPEQLIPMIIETWNKRGLKPYFHISEQGSGKIGHHSDFIEVIPEYMFTINQDITLDVEAKAKEKAIFKLVNKYKL